MLNFLKSISAKRPAPDGKPAVSVRERVSALRNLPAFLRLIWHTNSALALGNVARGVGGKDYFRSITAVQKQRGNYRVPVHSLPAPIAPFRSH